MRRVQSACFVSSWKTVMGFVIQMGAGNLTFNRGRVDAAAASDPRAID